MKKCCVLFIFRLRVLRDVVDVSVPNPTNRGTEQDRFGKCGSEGDVLLQKKRLAQPADSVSRQTPM